MDAILTLIFGFKDRDILFAYLAFSVFSYIFVLVMCTCTCNNKSVERNLNRPNVR